MIALAVLVVFTCTTGFAFNQATLERYASLMLKPAEAEARPMRVSFLGVSTLLFDDGETAILTDGFFTRPRKLAVLMGKIAPDREVIERSLQRAGIKKLAAVIVTHSHYDHVMDAPEVARRTGAVVLGSESTANVARGWGLPEDKIRVVRDGESLDFGKFHCTFVRSEHAKSLFTGGRISKPLVPPVRAQEYEEGGSLSLLLKHGTKTILVHGSAGFSAGALRGHQADVVFLGIGLLGKRNKTYKDAYWQETVKTVKARRVIPVHWDDFTRSLHVPLVPIPSPFDEFDKAMAFLIAQGEPEKIDVKLAPAWTPVDPFAGL